MTRDLSGRTALCFRFISTSDSEYLFLFLRQGDQSYLLAMDCLPAAAARSARVVRDLRADQDASEPYILTLN